MSDYVLGIDLGTSSLKGIVMDRTGKKIAEASSSYTVYTEAVGYSEQDPEDWFKACLDVFEQLQDQIVDFQSGLRGISFSGQMHSLVLLDEDKKVLCPAILWNDTRTTQQCQQIMSEYGQELVNITKNKALEGFTLPKIIWVKENKPDIWQDASSILLPKDYLRFRLTGQMGMDFSDAAGTLLLDIEEGVWSERILQRFDIPLDLLPPLFESHACVGDLTQEITDLFPFTHRVKVFTGGADNACAALGSGILSPDRAMSSIGTSGVILSVLAEKTSANDGNLHLFHHVIPNTLYAMGVTLSAGHSFSWFRKTFASDLGFDELIASIETIQPGSEGLLFTPYITGERTPHADSQIRGSFKGIDVQHTLAHFTRAVMEGITFSLKDSLCLMETERGKGFDSVVSVGGGAKSSTWLQIQADIFNTKVMALKEEEGPSMGAAMLAAIGLGWYDSFEAIIQGWVQFAEVYTPIPKHVEIYKKVYHTYQKIYSQTKDLISYR